MVQRQVTQWLVLKCILFKTGYLSA